MTSNQCSARIVSITKPILQEIQDFTPEELIVYIARVSNPDHQRAKSSTNKLIIYLLEHNHYSPFEMVDMTVEITTSRAIAAQILRHWSFSFQEFSQRYSKLDSSDVIEYDARRQDDKNRQNSIDDMSDSDKEWFKEAQIKVWATSKTLYDAAIERGIAKEQARFLLPLATKTRLYMKGSIRDWIFYLKLRSGNGTQKEHSAVANAVLKHAFIPNFPAISRAAGFTNKSHG